MTSPRTNLGIALVAIALVTVGISAVWADIATPRPQWTMVRMESETVGITLGEKKVAVEAAFNMYNEGKAGPVKMGYPVGLFETDLKDFVVTIDEKAVENVKTEPGVPETNNAMMRGNGQPESYRFEGPYKQWKVWEVAMEERAPKVIKLKYWVEPAKIKDAEKGDLLFYSYTLKTGATWKGKINKAVVTVTLDGVTPARLVRSLPIGAVASNAGKTLTWTMTSFKPTDNIDLTFRPSEAIKTAALTARR